MSNRATLALAKALPLAAAVLGLAVLGYTLALIWSGPQATWLAASRLGIGALAAGLAVVAFSFLLRHGRWTLLLRSFGHVLPFGTSLRIYLAGLALGSVPGKVGETLRSVFLLRHGVGWRQSLAAFFADRLSDVIGMALLGALAAAWAEERSAVLEGLGVVVLVGSFVLRGAALRPAWPARVARIAAGSRTGRVLAAALGCIDAWATAWHPTRVALFVAIAVSAYGLQALVFAHIVSAVALPLPAASCAVIFASATLLGAASGVPAGLGVMEAALVMQLTQAGAATDAALAAALLTRLVTFWFALALGAASLLSLGLRPAPRSAGTV